MSTRKIESFKPNISEIDISHKFAEYKRWNSDENIHINGFKSEERRVIDRSYSNVKKNELLKFNLDRDTVDKLIQDRELYVKYEDFQHDYIEEFMIKNSYSGEKITKNSKELIHVLNLEEISKYNYDSKDCIYEVCRKINIQKELLQLWELSDRERIEIEEKLINSNENLTKEIFKERWDI